MFIRTIAGLAVAYAIIVAPTGAVDRGTGETLDDARQLIETENWAAALPVLKRIVADRPDDADALNLLAYTLRHTGDFRNAEGFYLKALSIAPDHLGANEYLGELYVQTGALDKAAERLAVIEGICGTACAEYEELSAVINAAELIATGRQPEEVGGDGW